MGRGWSCSHVIYRWWLKPWGRMTSPRGRLDREKKRSPELSKCYASGREGRTSKRLRRSDQGDRRKTERLVLGVKEVYPARGLL